MPLVTYILGFLLVTTTGGEQRSFVIYRDEYLTSAARTRKIALKTARDREKNMTHDSVSIFFKLLLKNLL